MYRHSDAPPPRGRPRSIANPPGANRCPFVVVLVGIAATWHLLGEQLLQHGPVSSALAAVMACMFRGEAATVPVGSLPGETAVLLRFIDLYFQMNTSQVRGEQQAMCEIWGWLVDALRIEHYPWRNVAFYRGFAHMQPSATSLDSFLKPVAKGGKATDYAWLEAEHGWVQWVFPTTEQGMNPHSSPLSPCEVDVFRTDTELHRRGLRACGVFLAFLGLQFTDATARGATMGGHGRGSGRVRVSRVLGRGWVPRAQNWRTHPHNNLRVTRMLQFLMLMGHTQHAEAFVVFVQGEVGSGEMGWCRRALAEHWEPCV
eukprot:gene19700-biopygen33027